MQPQSMLSTWARPGGEGVGVTRRWEVREAQLDVQLETAHHMGSGSVCPLPCGDLSSGTVGAAEAGGPLVPEESRHAKLPSH